MFENSKNTFLLFIKQKYDEDPNLFIGISILIVIIIILIIYFIITADSYKSAFSAAETIAVVPMNKNTLYIVASSNPSLLLSDTSPVLTSADKITKLNTVLNNVQTAAATVKSSLFTLYGYSIILDKSAGGQLQTGSTTVYTKNQITVSTSNVISATPGGLVDPNFDEDVVKVFFNGKSASFDSTNIMSEMTGDLYDLITGSYF